MINERAPLYIYGNRENNFQFHLYDLHYIIAIRKFWKMYLHIALIFTLLGVSFHFFFSFICSNPSKINFWFLPNLPFFLSLE